MVQRADERRAHRLLRARDDDPAPALDVTGTARNTRTIEFGTAGRGDAYDFRVTADLCFCATGTLPWDRLAAKIDFWAPDLLAEIKAAVRPVARNFPPFRPGAAEPVVAEEAQQAVTRPSRASRTSTACTWTAPYGSVSTWTRKSATCSARP